MLKLKFLQIKNLILFKCFSKQAQKFDSYSTYSYHEIHKDLDIIIKPEL